MSMLKDYLRSIHVISQMDVYLINTDKIDVFHKRKKQEQSWYKKICRQSLGEFSDRFFKEIPQNVPVVFCCKTLSDLAYLGQWVKEDTESYLFAVGPFYMADEKNVLYEKNFRCFTEEELEFMLPLFVFQSSEQTPELILWTQDNADLIKKYSDTDILASNYDMINDNSVAEQCILHMIEMGDLQALTEYMNKNAFYLPEHYELDSAIRIRKNLAIIFNSLCCRAATKGGLPPVYARSYCASLSVKIENMNGQSELFALQRECPLEYCRKVYEYAMERYSPSVRECMNYIYAHMSEPVTLYQLAEHCNISYEHLSRLIKKECGVNYSVLIQGLRIRRAKSYLMTDMPVTEIADRLGYKSTSHFCHVFRQQTGLSTSNWKKL